MSKKKIVFLSVSVALLLSLLGGALFGQATQKNNAFRYVSIFTEVFELVKNNYVEPVPPEQLMDGAFAGVTDAIDEFSYYVPPAQMAAYKNFSDVEDNGVGLIVTKRFGYAFVIAPVAGSPAAKSGIERGDFIEKIDGQPTQKMAVWQVRNLLRSGKPMHLQVLRGGQTKRDEFTLQQAAFHPLTLTTQQMGGVAYIKVPYFEKGTAAQLAAALDNVHKSGTRKLIIDLRGNAGGDVEEAIKSADELLTSGLITSLAGKVEAKKWQADRNTDYDGDVEVLTDGSTASGAEIFAAAIHGNQRGKIVGVTTYGKSVVQKFITLPSGGGVYMTVAHYTSPDLKPIKSGGIRPDVIVDLTALALRDPEPSTVLAPHGAPKKAEKKPEDDLILQRALQLFNEPAAAAKKAA
ncbi:MAG: carboxyl-terminal processing protease [Thermoanaerobaculia bacterium]|jgi:carboxyl-terminal processing protease|nr:carboxyl-terminal processing protease [Thermoanaerobaculia bacterium]